MKKKNVLIDLSMLKNPNCGLGQIALNYGRIFGAMDCDDLRFTLLVPKRYIGAFGDKVGYANARRRKYPMLLPRADVIHATHQFSKLRRKDRHTKVILTVHDLNFLYEKTGEKQRKYMAELLPRVAAADVITTISNFSRQDVLDNVDTGDKPVEVIYNGVENIASAPAAQPAFVDTARPFFFTIGEVKRKKNFGVLLDVMKSFPGHDLYICGNDSGDYAQEIRERIAREGIGNVYVTGMIAPEEKVWLYKNCRALLFPSKFEGFGLPVIEAMQFGKPVFSSQMTSLREIGGGHAFAWENFEPESMAEVVRAGLAAFDADPSLAGAEKEYAASFSYERHIAAYLALYRRMLE